MQLLVNSSFRFSEDHKRRLREVCPALEVREAWEAPVESMDGREVDFLVSEVVPRDLAAWPRLRWVQLTSAGANHLLRHPIRDSNIVVTTANGLHGVPIAQYVVCVWLMMAHRMSELIEFKTSRIWPDRHALTGAHVRDLTVGLIGYGSIGRECGRLLSAMGMRVVALKRDPSQRRDDGYNAFPNTGDSEGRIPEAWYGPDQLSEFLPRCDVVVVTAPSTERTMGMMGAAELAMMKPGARLIIVSRGGIVSEPALADALRKGVIAEAAVDCFVGEPIPPSHDFFDVPNLIMTPHMSGISDSFWPSMQPLIKENLRRLLAGEPLINRIDWAAGY